MKFPEKLVLVFMLSIVCCVIVTCSMMCWADSGNFGPSGANGYMEGRRWVSVLIEGAASGNGTATIQNAAIKPINGRYIQKFITTPGSGDDAPTAYTATMSDGYGQSISIPARSTTAKEAYDVPANLGENWPVLDTLVITLTGMGEGKLVEVTILVH